MKMYGVVEVVMLHPRIPVIVINVLTGIADPGAIGAPGVCTNTSHVVIAMTRDATP